MKTLSSYTQNSQFGYGVLYRLIYGSNIANKKIMRPDSDDRSSFSMPSKF